MSHTIEASIANDTVHIALRVPHGLAHLIRLEAFSAIGEPLGSVLLMRTLPCPVNPLDVSSPDALAEIRALTALTSMSSTAPTQHSAPAQTFQVLSPAAKAPSQPAPIPIKQEKPETSSHSHQHTSIGVIVDSDEEYTPPPRPQLPDPRLTRHTTYHKSAVEKRRARQENEEEDEEEECAQRSQSCSPSPKDADPSSQEPEWENDVFVPETQSRPPTPIVRAGQPQMVRRIKRLKHTCPHGFIVEEEQEDSLDASQLTLPSP